MLFFCARETGQEVTDLGRSSHQILIHEAGSSDKTLEIHINTTLKADQLPLLIILLIRGLHIVSMGNQMGTSEIRE